MRTALVIEDDTTVRAFFKRILTNKFNFIISQANNGVEGLKILENSCPDIILLDITMPLMNGAEFLRSLRKDEKYKDIPVLVITASYEEEVVKEMIGLGIVDYILKWMEPDEILKRIQKAVDAIKSE